ncbi:MAG TPA: TolC family protein, partial [Bacteroidales bacterium]|nr:TolC family protein [Bacteroidales bacterium]
MKYRVVIPVVFLFTFFLPVSAQTPGDSLKSYLKIAASMNPVILQKYNEYQASVRRVAPAGTLQDPDLSIGVFLSPMEILSGRQVADIRLMQMFPWFGSLKAAKEEMSQMANADFEALRAARLQVSYDVRSTWYELIKTRESIRISQENINLLHTIEKLAIVRYKSGGQAGNITVNSPGAVQENPVAGDRPDGRGMQSMTGSQTTPTQPGSMQTMGSD